MKQAKLAAALRRLLLAVVMAALVTPAMARPVKVRLRVISGGLAFAMPASAYNKPLLSWDAKLRFLVHVVVQSNATQVVDETSGRGYMTGDKITLCYRVRKIKHAKPEDSTTVFPEIMEFYVPKASTRKKYTVTVKQNCK